MLEVTWFLSLSWVGKMQVTVPTPQGGCEQWIMWRRKSSWFTAQTFSHPLEGPGKSYCHCSWMWSLLRSGYLLTYITDTSFDTSFKNNNKQNSIMTQCAFSWSVSMTADRGSHSSQLSGEPREGRANLGSRRFPGGTFLRSFLSVTALTFCHGLDVIENGGHFRS